MALLQPLRNLFCLSWSLGGVLAWLCLGPAHPAALERERGLGCWAATVIGPHGPWQGLGVGGWNALYLFWKELNSLGYTQVDDGQRLPCPPPRRPFYLLSSGPDSSGALKPWDTWHTWDPNELFAGPRGPAEQRLSSSVLDPFPKISCSSHQQHDLYQPVWTGSPLVVVTIGMFWLETTAPQ